MNQQTNGISPTPRDAGNGGNMGSAGMSPLTPETTRCAPPDGESGIGDSLSLAMVYSPKQYWRKLYPLDRALSCGTLFEELDKPFLGWKTGVMIDE